MSGVGLLVVTVILLAVIGFLIGYMLVTAGHVFAVEVDPNEAAVREVLPGNNCGACGYPGCDGCAAAIAKGEAPVNACPVGGAAVADKVGAIMGVAAEEGVKNVAFVKCSGDCKSAKYKMNYIGIPTCSAAANLPGKGAKSCQYGCLGLGECVEACQFDAIHIIDDVAVVDRTKCVACGQCVKACPQHLIEIVPDDAKWAVRCASQDAGKTVKAQCSAGCIGCKLCTRQCKTGSITVVNNIAHIDYTTCTHCGDCAAKCPAKVIVVRNGEVVIDEKAG